jgi:stearoyl-CoA desaturase (delta-9 desaturase)
MWNTAKIYGDLVRNKTIPEPQFSQGLPEWPAFERFTDRWVVRLFWGVLYSCFYLHFVTDLWVLALLPLHYLMGPVHGAIVNWCGHKYGYRNFDNGDKSRNTLVWDLLMMGELYQNNHHKFPNRMNFAFRWFEFDPVFPIIWMLKKLRVVRLKANTIPL